jgi:uncharacterized protein YdaU (DUF1376 family)
MKERSGMPYDCIAIETDELAKSWTLAEEGAFHRLLRHGWINGSIPADPLELAGICRVPATEFLPLWSKLEKSYYPHPRVHGRLLNKKQEKERAFVSVRRRQQVAAGRRSAEVRRQRAGQRAEKQQKMNIRSTTVSTNVEHVVQASLNPPPRPNPSLPNPSPVPVPIHDPILNRSFVPIEAGNGRTDGQGQDIQKFWGPVEGYLRKQMVEETFLAFYAGSRLVNLDHRHVVVAVPQTLLDRNGDLAATEKLFTHMIEQAGTGLMRGRALKLVSLDLLEDSQT